MISNENVFGILFPRICPEENQGKGILLGGGLVIRALLENSEYTPRGSRVAMIGFFRFQGGIRAGIPDQSILHLPRTKNPVQVLDRTHAAPQFPGMSTEKGNASDLIFFGFACFRMNRLYGPTEPGGSRFIEKELFSRFRQMAWHSGEPDWVFFIWWRSCISSK